jgi:hypothetical protein
MKASVMGAELVAQESWLCWEEGDGFVTCTHGLGGPCYGGWCYGGRGAAEDGAAEDGAKEDGAAEDAVSGTHGLGGPCYGRRLRKTVLRKTVLRKTVLRWVGGVYEKTRKTQGIAG